MLPRYWYPFTSLYTSPWLMRWYPQESTAKCDRTPLECHETHYERISATRALQKGQLFGSPTRAPRCKKCPSVRDRRVPWRHSDTADMCTALPPSTACESLACSADPMDPMRNRLRNAARVLQIVFVMARRMISLLSSSGNFSSSMQSYCVAKARGRLWLWWLRDYRSWT